MSNIVDIYLEDDCVVIWTPGGVLAILRVVGVPGVPEVSEVPGVL